MKMKAESNKYFNEICTKLKHLQDLYSIEVLYDSLLGIPPTLNLRNTPKHESCRKEICKLYVKYNKIDVLLMYDFDTNTISNPFID